VVLAVLAALASAVVVPAAFGSSPSGGCVKNSRACVIEAGGKYLAALVSHDGSGVPLAPDAQRTENGDNTGDGADAIRAGLESPVMDVIVGVRDVRWFVDGEHATAFYLLDSSTFPPSPAHTATAHIAERFRVRDGLIHEIEAVFWITPGVEPGTSGWEE
jgi:hypothetical protein